MNETGIALDLKDVHQLVEHLGGVLQKAVILENKDFELIAYSAPNEYSFDSIQQKTILTKRCPLYVIEHLKTEGIVQKIREKKQPTRVHLLEDTHFYQRIAMSVEYRNDLYGYLWVYEANEAFDEKPLQLITSIANRIGEILYNEQRTMKDDVQSFLWNLVNDEYAGEMEIYQAAEKAAYEIPNNFSIAVMSVKEAKHLSILNTIKDLFRTMELTYYLGKGTEIIVMLDGNDEEATGNLVQTVLQEIEKLLGEEAEDSLFIGIGNLYNHIELTRKSYLEALEVIETMSFLNLQDQATYFYDDIGMYRHLKLMYKKNVSEQYRNKKILTLMDKDFKTNSELVKTVWHFLKNDCKVGKTAEDLFIHPNTLHYRLNQIDDIMHIDFNDMMEKSELFIELYLLHHVADYEEFYLQTIRPH